jgi:hypothetical protein
LIIKDNFLKINQINLWFSKVKIKYNLLI